jgi:hypothetical protein
MLSFAPGVTVAWVAVAPASFTPEENILLAYKPEWGADDLSLKVVYTWS